MSFIPIGVTKLAWTLEVIKKKKKRLHVKISIDCIYVPIINFKTRAASWNIKKIIKIFFSIHPSLILNKVISTKRHHSDIFSSKQMSNAQGDVWFSENVKENDFIMFGCLIFFYRKSNTNKII